MPKPSEDRFFGGKKGAAAEAFASMLKTYKSRKKAEEVYFATLNRNKARMRAKGNALSKALKK